MMTSRLAILTFVLVPVVAACSGGSQGKGSLSGAGGRGGSGAAGGHAPVGSGGTPGGMGGTNAGSGGTPGGPGGSTVGSGGAGSGGGLGGHGGAGAGGATADCTPLAPIPRRVLALQPTEYGNATRDLLGLAATPQVVGNDTPRALADAATYWITPDHLYAYYLAAGAIVDEIAPRAAARAACQASDQNEAQCATRFARTFGRLAFRRTLDDVEVTDIMKVFATVCPGPSLDCASEADFGSAIALMVKAFILAPSFLYRTELGPRDLTANAAGVYPDTMLTAGEIATQLAFVLLGSTPDADLLAAADSGALGTPTGLLTQVNRLLALPTVQSHVAGLVSTWLGIDRLPQRVKDATELAPLPTADQDQAVIAADLRTSWDRSLTDTLWSTPAGKVTDLLTAPTFFADWRLATLYGLPPVTTSNAAFYPLTWPLVQPRAGILTHPAFLWATSDPMNVSIVKRGMTLHGDIVCEDTVASDPELDSAAAMAVIATGDSEATKSDARLASGMLCGDNCHSELDPYGRVLHAFDAIGNYRTVDEAGRAIDSSVKLTDKSPLGSVTIAGPAAFAEALIATKVFTGCAVQRLLEAAVAVPITVRNTCQVNDLRTAFNESDGTMASLMRVLATSDIAHARAGGTK